MLADLLFASILALSASIVAVQATSMLVRQNAAAKAHRDEAYAFTALIEKVLAGSKDGHVEGRMGWHVRVEPLETPDMGAAFNLVRITAVSENGERSFTWESWRRVDR